VVRKAETLGCWSFDELKGYKNYDAGGVKGILNMKTERIKDIILYPYYFKIKDSLENIFESLKIEKMKKISEKNQMKYYKMLEKIRSELKRK
jgi:hypothetical protein